VWRRSSRKSPSASGWRRSAHLAHPVGGFHPRRGCRLRDPARMTGSERFDPLVVVGSQTTDAAAFRMPKAQPRRRPSPLRISRRSTRSESLLTDSTTDARIRPRGGARIEACRGRERLLGDEPDRDGPALAHVAVLPALHVAVGVADDLVIDSHGLVEQRRLASWPPILARMASRLGGHRLRPRASS
jgi:hypothetical protein